MVQPTGQTDPPLRPYRQFHFHVFQNVREHEDAYRMVGIKGGVVLAA
jgi:hypothetical protein